MKKLGIFYSFVGLIVLSAIIFIGELFIYKQLVAAVTVKLVTVFEDLLKNLFLGDFFDEHISSLSPTHFVANCWSPTSISISIYFLFFSSQKNKEIGVLGRIPGKVITIFTLSLQKRSIQPLDGALIYQIAQENIIELKKELAEYARC